MAPGSGIAPARTLRRVLVANRGEIARRVIRGAHDFGCEAVAVYAPDDATSPYVGEADAAVLLPGPGLARTYLDPRALVEAAQRAGADALHPGYGFLSENPSLAEACAAAGLVWVGPPSDAMRTMGHKARAKDVVSGAGVPVLPSVVVPAGATAAQLGEAAAAVGFPLLVKASAGGGGRGMRLVHDASVLGEAVAAAQREAAAAFGSDEVFLERFLEAPRHIEVQVIGDGHGTVAHLFDRECSIQRRHQKLVEEAPAVLVPLGTRQRMWEAAVAAARAVGYEGAGTVEFLVDGDDFSFLEMNTRLQVEHGVTELVTGLDLVGLQLAVASGRPLPFTQSEVATSGHAVEARLCAERPREDYRPTPGTVRAVLWPAGAGLRTDRGIESGTVVSPAYDSLVAKLMAHGGDRAGAIARLSLALRALQLDGLETNRELLQAVLDDGAYRRGDVDIHFLENRPDLRDAVLDDEVRHRHAAAVAAALLEERAARSLVPVPAAGWRNVGTALHADELTDAAGVLSVRLSTPGSPAAVLVDGDWRTVGTVTTVTTTGTADTGDAADTGEGGAGGDGATVDLATQSDGLRRRYLVRHAWGGHRAFVNGPEGQSTFALRTEDDPDDRSGTAGECRAPLPGAVTKVLVTVGERVSDGDGLVVLEAMKMEHTLRADGAGTVRRVLTEPGQQVDVGDLLVELEPPA
jgi:propionyl-CoA carboxylase alpha chain